jgi:hypothetical protein
LELVVTNCTSLLDPGLVTCLVAKRDIVLAGAIEECIKKGLPIDSLTSDKKDYTVRALPIDGASTTVFLCA